MIIDRILFKQIQKELSFTLMSIVTTIFGVLVVGGDYGKKIIVYISTTNSKRTHCK